MRLTVFLSAMAISVAAGSAAAITELRPLPAVAEREGPPMCEPADFKIYFEHGKEELTAPAVRTIDVVASHVRGCEIVSVKLQSDAAAVSTAEGRRIAGQRGAKILAALRARGVASDTLLVSAVGSPGEPASAEPEHLSVVVDAAPPALSARGRSAGDTDV